MTMDTFRTEAIARHEAAAARGEHDAQCEWGPRIVPRYGPAIPPAAREVFEIETFMHLCHCAKRRRLAAGRTTPPGPLVYRAPDCPGCYREVSFDGDAFVCGPCGVRWIADDPEDGGTFIDDYGDIDWGRPA